MKRLIALAMASLVAVPSYAADAAGAACATTHVDLMRATRYTELVRMNGSGQCASRSVPNFVALCTNIGQLSDAAIEGIALPMIKKSVSCDMAKSALTFWSTPDGKVISKKVMQGIARGSGPVLAGRESALYEQFMGSPAGQTMNLYTNNNQVNSAILTRIAAYKR
ncbi:hypothetical protein [Crenobacter cavernae]|nr:hypothetical protein [Crenobacter cavernae]